VIFLNQRKIFAIFVKPVISLHTGVKQFRKPLVIAHIKAKKIINVIFIFILGRPSCSVQAIDLSKECVP
jgi:hypothetical protein